MSESCTITYLNLTSGAYFGETAMPKRDSKKRRV